MQKRPLGNTGLMVTPIGFGAIKLHGIDHKTASDCLNRALDLGVNFVDTARNYRDSEAKIGAALKGRRDEYYLATKSANRDDAGLMADLETSLRELQTDVIDLYQLHTVSDRETYDKVMAPGGALEAAKRAQQQGKVKHVGVTIHRDIAVMRDCIQCGAFETVMLAHSLMDPENVQTNGILDLAKEHGMGVVVMKALAGGALSTPSANNEHVKDDPIVRGVLRYLLADDRLSCIIPGIMRVEEVEENVATGEIGAGLTEDESAQLLREIGKSGKKLRYGQTCLRCGYCQPCPEGIAVPEFFRAADMYEAYPDGLKHQGVDLYKSLEPKPDVCVECRECVEKCPAQIDIPERLKEVADMFADAS